MDLNMFEENKSYHFSWFNCQNEGIKYCQVLCNVTQNRFAVNENNREPPHLKFTFMFFFCFVFFLGSVLVVGWVKIVIFTLRSAVPFPFPYLYSSHQCAFEILFFYLAVRRLKKSRAIYLLVCLRTWSIPPHSSQYFFELKRLLKKFLITNKSN